jgi:hypothetical protein
LIWTPTYSWYEYVCLSGKGMIVANTPWSGHYSVPDAVWMVAHTSQFVQPGWRFLTSPGASAFLPDRLGSIVSYASAGGTDLSIVIETGFSNSTNTLELNLAGKFSALSSLHWWRTNRSAVFLQQPPLLLRPAGKATLVIPAGEVWTLTTTTGQQKGSESLKIPPAANFSLPYADDFDGVPADATPKYTSDMHGVFTAATASDEGGGVTEIPGRVLRQQTASAPSCTHCGGSSAYGTIIGDGSWLDYSVSISARVTASTSATEGDRLKGAPGGPFVFLGSHLGVFEDGSLGTNGLWPYYVHSSRHPPGFMLTVYFDKNPKGEWFLEAGEASPDMDGICHTGHAWKPAPASTKCTTTHHPCPSRPGRTFCMSNKTSGQCDRPSVKTCPPCPHAESGGSAHSSDDQARQGSSEGSGNNCPMVLAGNGTLDSGVDTGQWLDLKLSAKRLGNGKTQLDVMINGVAVVTGAQVATAPQARGAVTLGCGLHHAEYDNLTVTPL